MDLPSWHPFAVVHLRVAAVWLGAMTYSLRVVQPSSPVLRRRGAAAQRNRWPVGGAG